jgi:hypothetical protein
MSVNPNCAHRPGPHLFSPIPQPHSIAHIQGRYPAHLRVLRSGKGGIEGVGRRERSGEEGVQAPGEFHHPMLLCASTTSNCHPLTEYPHPRRPPSSKNGQPQADSWPKPSRAPRFLQGARKCCAPFVHAPPTTSIIPTPPNPTGWGLSISM